MCISFAWLSAHTVVRDHHQQGLDYNISTWIVIWLHDCQHPDYTLLSMLGVVSLSGRWQRSTLSRWPAWLGNRATATIPWYATAHTGKWMNSGGLLAITPWCPPYISASEPFPCDTLLASFIGNKRLVSGCRPTAIAMQTRAETPVLWQSQQAAHKAAVDTITPGL